MEGDFEMTKNNDQKIEIVHSNLVTFDPVGDWDKSFCIFVCNRDLKLDLLEFIIKNLIKNGCRFFSCFGKFSEFVHDFIDDIVESDHNIFIDTITVFNKKSSMEEMLYNINYHYPTFFGPKRIVIIYCDYEEQCNYDLNLKE